MGEVLPFTPRLEAFELHRRMTNEGSDTHWALRTVLEAPIPRNEALRLLDVLVYGLLRGKPHHGVASALAKALAEVGVHVMARPEVVLLDKSPASPLQTAFEKKWNPEWPWRASLAGIAGFDYEGRVLLTADWREMRERDPELEEKYCM